MNSSKPPKPSTLNQLNTLVEGEWEETTEIKVTIVNNGSKKITAIVTAVVLALGGAIEAARQFGFFG